MRCLFCNGSTKVFNSRSSHQNTQTWRRRKCLNCNKIFTTREKVDFTGVVSIKSPAGESPYSRERLLLSLVRASDKLEFPTAMLTELTDSIELELKQSNFFNTSPQDSKTISSSAIAVLKRYDKNLAIQYINNIYANKPPLEILQQLLTN